MDGTCRCGTFNLDSCGARVDGCGFLHTASRCPDEKWDDDAPQTQRRAKYPRATLDKLLDAGEISETQYERLLRD
jgi:hypothetical protein